MSDHESKPLPGIMQMLLPVAVLLCIEILCWVLNGQWGMSSYAIALFAAEILLLIVFIKGQICTGQRGRLVSTNLMLMLFWLVAFIVGGCQFPVNGFLLPLIIPLLGMGSGLLIYRRTGLTSALVFAGLGILLSLYQTAAEHGQWLSFNPIAQLLLGVILTNLALLVSRNRLQAFIALLPFAMALLLALNMLFVLLMLGISTDVQPTAADLPAEWPLLLYFALHLLMMAIIGVHIWHKVGFGYFSLMLLLIMTASLPLWMQFVRT